jgi:hypothetical protein
METNSEPMKFEDAGIVATVLMLVSLATLFLPAHDYNVFLLDAQKYLFDLGTFIFSSWITFFGSLTGLMAYTRRTEKE